MDDFLKQQIKDTIPPQNRVLIILLILTVIALFGLLVRQSVLNEREIERLRVQTEKVNEDWRRKAQDDNDKLLKIISSQEYIKQVMDKKAKK